MVKVGSARLNEYGTTKGGSAGDQTKKEVSTQDWYLHKSGWVVLRPKREEVAELIALAMELACANDKIGYCQDHRNDLYNAIKDKNFDISTLDKKVEVDCSALVRVCVAFAGIETNDFNTVSEVAILTSTNEFYYETSDKYCKSSDYLKRGDILVTRVQGHTVVVLSNGSKANSLSNAKDNKYTIDNLRADFKAILDATSNKDSLDKTVTISVTKNKNHKLVTPLERYMKTLGYYTGKIEVDEGKTPCFGNGMESAIKKYQKEVVNAIPKYQDGILTAKGATYKKLLGV